MARSRVVVVPLLLGVLLALVPLAHATPPDQTWRPGIYDGDDFDDVVSAATSSVSTVEVTPLSGLGPEQVALGLVPCLESADPSQPVASSVLSRAPPLG